MDVRLIINSKSMDYTSILGIDVASEKLDLCFSRSGDNQYYQIDYADSALEAFLAEHPDIAPGHCLVGMESTGDYHLKAAKHFLKNGFAVKIINPILTKQYTRTTIRGTKTDKSDSELICRLLLQGEGDFISLDRLKNDNKEYLRLSSKLKDIAKSLKLKTNSLARKELNNQDMENRLEAIILELNELSNDLTAQATAEISEEEKLIDSIPGFAVKLSAVVHHELGDVKRFDNVKSLIAYAGLDPRIKQSGKGLNTFGRITKRGSPYLRTALFLAANIARRYDPELAEYYRKKKDENRRYKEIMCMIARKLLVRIYAVLKEQRPYVIHNLT